MKITVHSIHFNADQKLIDFINERVNRLDQYYDGIIGGEVFLRLDKADNTENKIAEIKLAVAGKELFAKKQCKSFEEATDHAVSAIKRQITKHKTKQRAV